MAGETLDVLEQVGDWLFCRNARASGLGARRCVEEVGGIMSAGTARVRVTEPHVTGDSNPCASARARRSASAIATRQWTAYVLVHGAERRAGLGAGRPTSS